MTLAITHVFVSAKGDGPDPTVVRPSDWNKSHVITVGADNTILGRAAGLGPGAVQELPKGSVFDPGMMMMYAGAVAPPTWHLCDGGLLSRTTEAALFAAIGTTYGPGDGSTTFAKPDMRGRVAAHPDGGTGRLTASGLGVTAVLGAVGGSQTEGASVSVSGLMGGGGVGVFVNVAGNVNGASNNHAPGSGVTSAGYGDPIIGTGTGNTASLLVSGSLSGASAVVTNTQPTLIVNYIIKG